MTADALLSAPRELVGHLAELSHSNSADSLLEIAAAGVSKASALARVCAERGIAQRASGRVRRHAQRPADAPVGRPRGRRGQRARRRAGERPTRSPPYNDDAGVARVLERLFASPARAPTATRQARMSAGSRPRSRAGRRALGAASRRARRFYGELLGLPEIDKPEPLRARGGVWFALGGQQLHVGVQEPFSPARKAHPALRARADELDALARRLAGARRGGDLGRGDRRASAGSSPRIRWATGSSSSAGA